jgi:G3E family GTPase
VLLFKNGKKVLELNGVDCKDLTERLSAVLAEVTEHVMDIPTKKPPKPMDYGTMEKRHSDVPVTILSGFLGAGKTTLLNHILTNKQDMKVGLLVNDMGAINVDAQVLRTDQADNDKETDSGMITLANGCICCSLRADLLREVVQLALSNQLDYIVVEGSGIAEPQPIAEMFMAAGVVSNNDAADTTSKPALDTLVTVVNCEQFLDELDADVDGIGSRAGE